MPCAKCEKKKRRQEKLSSILNGWKNLVWENKKVERIAKERLKICMDCDQRRGVMCKQCGCPIAAKARSMKETCKMKKWKL